jgi:hypothetical protein
MRLQLLESPTRKTDELAVGHRLSRQRKVKHGLVLGSADLDWTTDTNSA